MLYKLTIKFINDLKPITTKGADHTRYCDDSMPRFGLDVSRTGKKTFFIRYRNKYGKQKYLSLGDISSNTLAEARARARDLLHQIDLGNDPALEKQKNKQALTIAELCDEYMEKGTTNKKKSTLYIDKGRINNYIKPGLGSIPVEALTTNQVEDFMIDITKSSPKYVKKVKLNKPRAVSNIRGGADAASRVIQLLGAILTYAVKREYIIKNVAHNVDIKKSTQKKVFLTENEITELGKLLNYETSIKLQPVAINAIKLLLMTGCRRDEILTLKWDYIDFDAQIFRFPDTKTGKQDRPFGKSVRELLLNIKENYKNNKINTEWVCPSQNNPKLHLTDLLDIFKKLVKNTIDPKTKQPVFQPTKNITPHVFRHTFATICADSLHFSTLTIAGLLGHSLLRKTTDRYTHLVDSSQIKAADEASEYIYNLIKG